MMLSLQDIRKLLKASSEARNLKLGQTIHAHLLVSNQISRDHVIQRNSLINLYSKCGETVTARKLFDNMRKRNVVSWGSLMAGYLHQGLASEVLGLCRDMVKEDKLGPNKYILATVLSCCSHCGFLDEGQQCHGYALKSGMIFHHYVKNALVSLYSMLFDVEKAVLVLNSVCGSDICTYNSLLNGLLDQGYLEGALDVLRIMMAECEYTDWDSVTFVNVFGICTVLGDLNFGQQVHNGVLKKGMDADLFVGSTIIDMYGKCGEISSVKKAFCGLQTKNVVIWTSLLTSYLQNQCFEEVLKQFIQMGIENVVPNEYTLAVVLNSCAGLSALGYGKLLHAHVEKIGMSDYTIVDNAVVNMYSRCGLIEDSYTAFKHMLYRDFISWNSMISAFSYHGLGEEALSLFQQMLCAKQQPNYVTFVAVLSACASLGRLDEGFYYLNHMMQEFGIEPGLEHFTCIVGLLGRAGKLEEAENFMKSKPVIWDVVAWRTLLNACIVHRNYGIGKRVAELVLLMNPNDVGTYILMSNMHAKAKRWDKVVSVRKLARERNIKKEPGQSWVEIRDVTRIFVTDFSENVDSLWIHEKVKNLLADIKPLGYVPDTTTELHDVEEEQKEDYLSYHSEKLAIAYGLVKTPPRAPIRVVKNLRMCDDCHSAAKYISKLTRRHIVVRDANRYHHFRDGFCSCADYW